MFQQLGHGAAGVARYLQLAIAIAIDRQTAYKQLKLLEHQLALKLVRPIEEEQEEMLKRVKLNSHPTNVVTVYGKKYYQNRN